MGCRCNLAYLGSKSGIFKIITVVLAFIPAVAFIVAHSADYFKTTTRPFTSSYNGEDSCVFQQELNKVAGRETKTCPRNWMVDFPMACQIICFLASLIMLIILLVTTDLNKSSIFKVFDFIGHFIAGGISIIDFILIVVYIILAINLYPCGHIKHKIFKEACVQNREERFALWACGIAGAISLINGAVYCITAVFVKKQ